MDVAHIANAEEGVGGGEMTSFEGSRLRRQMFM